MRPPERTGHPERTPSLMERIEALAGRSNPGAGTCESAHRISRAYVVAAWISLLAGVLFWNVFVAAASGFYLAAVLLRREGL